MAAIERRARISVLDFLEGQRQIPLPMRAKKKGAFFDEKRDSVLPARYKNGYQH